MKNLNDYLNKIRNTENKEKLYAREEIRSLVDAKNTSFLSKLTKGNTMIKTLSTLLILGTSSLLLLFNNQNKNESKLENEDRIITVKKVDISELKADEPRLVPQNSIPVLNLSPDELKEIGIIYNDNEYELTTQTTLDAESLQKKAKKHNYPNWDDKKSIMKNKTFISERDIDDEIIDYKHPSDDDIDSLLPISYQRYSLGDGIISKASFGFTPLLKKGDIYKLVDEKDKLLKKCINQKIDFSEIDFLTAIDELRVADRMVIVPLSFEDGDIQSLLWFIKSDKLAQKVPSRYKYIFDEQNLSKEKPVYFEENTMPIIHLNEKELKQLGITRNKSGEYQFLALEEYSQSNEMKLKIARKHKYPTNNENFSHIRRLTTFENDYIKSDYMDYSGWDLTNENIISPYRVNYSKTESGKVSYNTTFTDYNFLDQQKKEHFDEELEKIVDAFKEYEIDMLEHDYLGIKDGLQVLDKFACVYLPSKDENRYKLLFYLPTEEFIGKLPERYQFGLRGKLTELSNQKIKAKPKETTEKQNIAGITNLELTDKELEKLGFFKKGESYIFEYEKKYDMSDFYNSVVFDPEEIYQEEIEKLDNLEKSKQLLTKILEDKNYQVKDTGTYKVRMNFKKTEKSNTKLLDRNNEISNLNYPLPYYISEDWKYFTYDETYEYWGKNEISQMQPLKPIKAEDGLMEAIFEMMMNDVIGLNDKLIPVTITLGDPNETDTSKINFKKLRIWYEITPEFVELLPDRYRLPMQNELNIAEKVNNGEMTVEQACEVLDEQEQFMGLCEKGGHNITVGNIWPNPITSNQINCKLIATKCNLEIDLYTANGEFIESLYNAKVENAVELNLNIKEQLQQGVYLIIFKTDKGDYVSKKVVVG